MTYAVRPATEKDIPSCIAIQRNDGFPHQYYLTAARLQRLFARREQFFLAEDRGVPVGFGSVDCEIRAQVHFICVDQAHIRKGIGRSLMRRCLDYAQQAGCRRVFSYVEAQSSKESFLERMGFHRVGFYKDRYGNGVDASIWEISLG